MLGVGDRRTAAREKGRVNKGSETCYDVWFREGGTNEKAVGEAAGGREDDVKILIKRNPNGQD